MTTKIFKKMQELNNSLLLQEQTLPNVLTKLKEISGTCKRKFDESVDIVIGLNINLKKDQQGIRGSCVLPHGTGKKIKLAVFAEGKEADMARECGADIVGGEELIIKIKNGDEKLDVSKCVATPAMMVKIKQISSILGKRGLMPNPKDGTITDNITSVVKGIKKGIVFFHNDKFGYIHASVGKVSFPQEQLEENIKELISTIIKFQKNTKGLFLKKIYLSTTMGLSLPLDVNYF